MLRISVAFILLALSSCAFDGPGRPDIPVVENIILYSGPGDAGKYSLMQQSHGETGDFFTPLVTDDSLVKLVVKGKLVFVKAGSRYSEANQYKIRYITDAEIIVKKITVADFDKAVKNCPDCKTIPVPAAK